MASFRNCLETIPGVDLISQSKVLCGQLHDRGAYIYICVCRTNACILVYTHINIFGDALLENHLHSKGFLSANQKLKASHYVYFGFHTLQR